mmetsp:Transcript_4000/g.7328  ORF Transcript_4000/g.7328 Transcript_4000/m.7328 type:complete len:134 (+) Transcript_4000:1816-2217(+)
MSASSRVNTLPIWLEEEEASEDDDAAEGDGDVLLLLLRCQSTGFFAIRSTFLPVPGILPVAVDIDIVFNILPPVLPASLPRPGRQRLSEAASRPIPPKEVAMVIHATDYQTIQTSYLPKKTFSVPVCVGYGGV